MSKFLVVYDVTQEILDESLVDNTYDKIRRELKRVIFSQYNGKEISRTAWVGEFVDSDGEVSAPAKSIKLTLLNRLKAKGFDPDLLSEHVRMFVSLLPDDIWHIDYQNPACDDNVRNSLRNFVSN